MFIVQEDRSVPGVSFLRLVGKPTDEELQIYLDAEKARHTPGRRLRLVLVLELGEVWTSKQRRMMRDFELEVAKAAPGDSLGMAIVVPNALIRGAFTAYYWLAPASYPTKMVANAIEAYDWVSERLAASGLPVPSRTVFELTARAHWPAKEAVAGRGLVPIAEGEMRGKLRAS